MTKPSKQLSISAVAELTGVSTHTLRKWESRHNVVEPKRTETGRRYYTEDQLERVKLVKLLLSHGHTLPFLAEQSDQELASLAEQHSESFTSTAVNSIDVVGRTPCARLRDWGERDVRHFAMDGVQWLQSAAAEPPRDALLIELPTLPDAICQRLAALRSDTYAQIVVFSRIASRRTRRQLKTQGIVVLDAIIPTNALLALLTESFDQPAIEPTKKSRFTSEQLASVATMTPTLACECPNHIAQLLIDISAFEQYCAECVDLDPQEKLLHSHLGEITANARRLFEDALIAVAEADNLDLVNIS